eukprot:scaffold1403_cov381-Prasinococcus_capsulatus_cf.AAC.4
MSIPPLPPLRGSPQTPEAYVRKEVLPIRNVEVCRVTDNSEGHEGTCRPQRNQFVLEVLVQQGAGGQVLFPSLMPPERPRLWSEKVMLFHKDASMRDLRGGRLRTRKPGP